MLKSKISDIIGLIYLATTFFGISDKFNSGSDRRQTKALRSNGRTIAETRIFYWSFKCKLHQHTGFSFTGLLRLYSVLPQPLILKKKQLIYVYRHVEFSANSTHAPELQIEFFSKCDAARDYEKAPGCGNVAEGVPIDFKLQLTLNNPSMKTSVCVG